MMRPLNQTLVCSCSQRLQIAAGSSVSGGTLDGGKSEPNFLTSKVNSTDGSASNHDTKFIEDAVKELLKARCVLCGSYVYGYYLIDNGYNKTIFEFMQVSMECLGLID